MFYSVRSERQLVEQLRYNMLFRWISSECCIDDPVGTRRTPQPDALNGERLSAGPVRVRWALKPYRPWAAVVGVKPLMAPTRTLWDAEKSPKSLICAGL